MQDLPPEVVEMAADSSNEELLASMLQQELDVTTKRAKRAVKDLRKTGKAVIPHKEEAIDRPEVTACAPDADVIFPAWTIDPQKAPYVFYRVMMTPQEILGRVENDGWDEEWAEWVIERARGKSSIILDSAQAAANIRPLSRYHVEDNDLVEVLYMYQRLVDDEDGSEGIYRTIFSPCGGPPEGGSGGGYDGYAKRELMSGCTRYPFVVTRLIDDEQRIYDLQTFPDLLKSAQHSVKAERDARIDSNSLRNCPPLLHPAGRPPTGTWGPGGRIGYRRANDFQYADTPAPNPQSMADEQAVIQHVEKMLGLDPTDPDGGAIKEYFISRFLEHQKRVLEMCYDMHQKYGPDELFIRITGSPDLERFEKREGERLDVTIAFDTQLNDPEGAEKIVNAVSNLFPLDDSGTIDKPKAISMLMGSLSPVLQSELIKPADVAQRDFERLVVDDLTRITSGFEVNAQPNGAPLALSVIQRWASQPDVMATMQQNPLMQERVKKYAEQYLFQQQQAVNAQTGRLGTPPAEFSGVEEEPMGATA